MDSKFRLKNILNLLDNFSIMGTHKGIEILGNISNSTAMLLKDFGIQPNVIIRTY